MKIKHQLHSYTLLCTSIYCTFHEQNHINRKEVLFNTCLSTSTCDVKWSIYVPYSNTGHDKVSADKPFIAHGL